MPAAYKVLKSFSQCIFDSWAVSLATLTMSCRSIQFYYFFLCFVALNAICFACFWLLLCLFCLGCVWQQVLLTFIWFFFLISRVAFVFLYCHFHSVRRVFVQAVIFFMSSLKCPLTIVPIFMVFFYRFWCVCFYNNFFIFS